MSKIAIIDDDTDIVEAIGMILNSKGYSTVAAYNIEDAFKLIEEEKPDMIIVDIMMVEPDDGIYLANKLRKNGYKKPIIMLSSVAKVTGFSYGASSVVPVDEFLEKPVAPQLLLEKVNYYLEQSKGN